ncbi:MAG: glutaminyl-peptide cyclotransferase, partial [Chitinivibrionales bacterium]|nr:glutaminyl-peptide cyclotransferase [Chitinivibrionales bacterium]MBD3356819.1 glutaminyl-peptide cyclotransferase [Chitinivibrionales bacterium]
MHQRQSLHASIAGLMLAAVSLTCDSAERTPPPLIQPTILRTLPHDTLAFTQGLLYHDGLLYESTGRYGRSSLRKLDTKTGGFTVCTSVDSHYFAEGLALHDNNLVQLTWQSGRAFVYAYPSLELSGTYRYEGEGWGLTTMDSLFIMSNGSDTLTFLDRRF